MSGACQPNMGSEETPRQSFPITTEDRKRWHFSTPRKMDIVKARKKKKMAHEALCVTLTKMLPY